MYRNTDGDYYKTNKVESIESWNQTKNMEKTI